MALSMDPFVPGYRIHTFHYMLEQKALYHPLHHESDHKYDAERMGGLRTGQDVEPYWLLVLDEPCCKTQKYWLRYWKIQQQQLPKNLPNAIKVEERLPPLLCLCNFEGCTQACERCTRACEDLAATSVSLRNDTRWQMLLSIGPKKVDEALCEHFLHSGTWAYGGFGKVRRIVQTLLERGGEFVLPVHLSDRKMRAVLTAAAIVQSKRTTLIQDSTTLHIPALFDLVSSYLRPWDFSLKFKPVLR